MPCVLLPQEPSCFQTSFPFLLTNYTTSPVPEGSAAKTCPKGWNVLPHVRGSTLAARRGMTKLGDSKRLIFLSIHDHSIYPLPLGISSAPSRPASIDRAVTASSLLIQLRPACFFVSSHSSIKMEWESLPRWKTHSHTN